MKLELIGHDEKYAVEQSLLTLFPDERPVYGPVTDEDASAARITLTEDADSICVTTELRQSRRRLLQLSPLRHGL